jgi:hypothetical protein
MAFTRQIMNAQVIVLRYCALIIRHEAQVIWKHFVYYVAILSITVTHKITPYVDCEPIRGLLFLKDKKFVAGDPSKEDCVLGNMVY